MQRLDSAQTKMSTQSEIQLASDDPIVATKALKYRNYVATIEQYQSNAADATSWMEVTEDALGSLEDIVQRTRELTVQAASGTLSESDQADIAEEIGELKSSAVEVLNSTYAGRYIFGGYATDKAPYSIQSTSITNSSTSGTTSVDQVLFKGKYLSLYGAVSSSVADSDLLTAYNSCAATTTGGVTTSNIYTSTTAQTIRYNTGYSSETAVNVEGQDVTGTGAANLFDTLDKLLLGLDGETSFKKVVVDATTSTAGVITTDFSLDGLLTDIDENLSLISTATADLGARMNYVDTCTSRLANDYTTYTDLLSSVVDVDVAQASIAVTTANTIYSASLTVGAKVVSETLVDYIK